MNEQISTPKGKAFNLENYVEYADGSVVSKTLLKKEIGNITLINLMGFGGCKNNNKNLVL